MQEDIQERYILADVSGKPEPVLVQVTLIEGSYIETYWNLVHAAMEMGNSSALKEAFEHTAIHDIHGNTYKLVTSLNTIYAWDRSLTSEEKRSYKEER